MISAIFLFEKKDLPSFWFIKSNEGSEDSHIGLADFFSGKSLKILMHFAIYALFEFE